MKIYKKKLPHRIGAVILCGMMAVLACLMPMPAVGAETEAPTRTESPVRTEAPDLTETPEETEAPKETETTQPVIKFPSVTETPDVDIPKGKERSDQHMDETAYLLKHADKDKIGEGGELKPVDIVYLTLTMADRSCFDHDPTLKELWQTDKDKDGYSDNAEAFMWQEASYAILYATSTDSAYYAAKIDRASSTDMWVTDFGAANSRNGNGEVCEGVIYDKKTGIAYIPRKFCGIPKQGADGLGMVRMQLLYAVRGNNIMQIDTNVQLNVTGDAGAAAREVDVTAALPGTTVTLSEGSEVESVKVDGREIDKEDYSYDKKTGELTVYQSASTMDSLDVKMSGKAAARVRTMAGSPGPAKTLDQALEAAGSNWNLPGIWQFSRNPTINDDFEITGTSYYFHSGEGFSERGIHNAIEPAIDIYASDDQKNSGTQGTYTKADAFDEKLGQDILNDTWGMGDYNGRHWDGLANARSHFSQPAMTRGLTIAGGSWDIAGYNLTVTIPQETNINMMCSHVDLSLGDFGGTDRTVFSGAKLRVRILGTNSAQNKMLVSIGTAMVDSQSGVGLYIINYQLAGGKIKVEKTAQGGYSLSGAYYNINGAKYGLFRDSAGTQRYDASRFADIIVNGAATLSGIASAEWDQVPAGTYYVKETQASSGFYLDAAVHKVTVSSGNTSTVKSVEKPHLGGIELEKNYDMFTGAGTLTGAQWVLRLLLYGGSNYSVNGAEYGLWTNSACSGNPISKRTTAHGANSDGHEVDGYAKWDNLPLGTYYVREITASPGCKRDMNTYTCTITEDNYTRLRSVSSLEPVPPGYILVYKEPKTPDAVNGNSYYSLDGAEFSLYADEDCKKLIETKTVHYQQDSFGDDPYSFAHFTIFGPLPIGVYYLRETNPPKGYTINYPDTTKPRKVEITKEIVFGDEDYPTVKVTWEEPEKRGLIRLYKESIDPDFTEHDTRFNFEGAVYGLYRDKACTDLVSTKTFVRGAPGNEHFVVWTQLPLGKYYIRELEAPVCGWFALDKNIYEAELTYDAPEYDKCVQEVTSVEEFYGQIDLVKKSKNPDMTDGNPLYSLAGAEYELYSDAKLTQSVGKRVTDKNGHVVWEKLPHGTYYAKETKPSPGFGLDRETHKFTIDRSNVRHTIEADTVEIESYEPPVHDPAGITINKIWNGEETKTVPPLVGTRFTIRYYAGDYEKNNLPASPTRTWVLEVKGKEAGGYGVLLRDRYLASGETSDPFYRITSGENPVLPLGTYTVQETKPAPGYTLSGDFKDEKGNSVFGLKDGELTDLSQNFYFTKVLQNGDEIKLDGGNVYTSEDDPASIHIELHKKDTKGKPLQGVTFEIRNGKGEPATDKNGSLVSPRTTDSAGLVSWDDLYPDVYTITETATAEGQTLLAEPVVIEAPTRITEQQRKDYGIDKNKLVWCEAENVWLIERFTYEITNGAALIMPMAGVSVTIKRFLPIAAGVAAFALMCGIGYPMFIGRRRKHRK